LTRDLFALAKFLVLIYILLSLSRSVSITLIWSSNYFLKSGDLMSFLIRKVSNMTTSQQILAYMPNMFNPSVLTCLFWF